MEAALALSVLMTGAAYFVMPVSGPLEVTLAARAAQPRDVAKPVIVSIAEDGALFLASRPVTRAQLSAHLAGIDQSDRLTTRVFVRAHPRLAHGKTMAVMQAIVAEGFDNIALVPGGNGAAVERGFGAAIQQD
jgi:biopolymer transport protein ExbD